MSTIRVAASQYTVGNDSDANLQKLLDVIDEAADGGAQLIVSPEFANYPSAYRDADHCWETAVDPEGDFVQAVRDKARERGIHVVFNATTRGPGRRVHDTNFLVGPDGAIIGTSSKQVLIGIETEYISPAPEISPVFETQLGRIGLYSCMDGVIPETPRLLALQGAQILANSLNSMALDEASLHIPVRAAENGVWVVAANKSGPILPPAELEMVARTRGMEPHVLIAPGEAQVVDPAGRNVAQGRFQTDDIVFADIDPSLADSKTWAEGDLFADRRPEV